MLGVVLRWASFQLPSFLHNTVPGRYPNQTILHHQFLVFTLHGEEADVSGGRLTQSRKCFGPTRRWIVLSVRPPSGNYSLILADLGGTRPGQLTASMQTCRTIGEQVSR